MKRLDGSHADKEHALTIHLCDAVKRSFEHETYNWGSEKRVVNAALILFAQADIQTKLRAVRTAAETMNGLIMLEDDDLNIYQDNLLIRAG